MKFESLPSEVIFETFEYLNGIDICRGFWGLNTRFNELLNNSFKFYRLDFRSVSKSRFTTVCEQYVPLIIDKVISLYLADDDETPNLPSIFLSYNFTFDQMTHLKSLTLQSIPCDSILNQILVQCRHLPHFTHLKLIDCLFDNENSDLVNNIWSLPNLIHCHIDDVIPKRICFSKLLITSSTLKSLSIKKLNSDFSSLSYIFNKTPCLQRLSTAQMCTDKNGRLQLAASNLTNLNILFHGSAASMMHIFEQTFNLRYLTLTISYLVLNGDEWEYIINHYLPNLKVFRLKMDFHFSENDNIQDKIDELLDTYQSDFWIKEHRWFVRCDWDPSNPFSYAILYTLPYAFDQFHYNDEMCSKSTCPNTKNFWSYNHVQTLQHKNNTSNHFAHIPIRFPNISHLEIILPFAEKFLSAIPTLDNLKSLDVTLLSGNSVYDQLQLLINRAPRLHMLRFSHLYDLENRLFQIQSESIRRIDFFTKESMLYSWYFNTEQCLALSNSSLGQQCQTLVIDIKNRANIKCLIDHMTNLQSLVFQCKDDTWTGKTSSTKPDGLIQWLHEHLPTKCSVTRNPYQTSIIQAWFR